MFHSNVMLFAFTLTLIINLSKCNEDALIELDDASELFKRNRNINEPDNFGFLLPKKLSCSCTDSCVDKNSFKLQKSKNTFQIIDRNKYQSKESSSSDDLDDLKKSFKLDMSASIRNFVSRLRPQGPLSAFGINSDLNQMSYAPLTAYGYRPSLSNLGINHYGHLDMTPEFTPFISNGLGSSLGTPYGTGLGIGSSFGIYDNFYPNSIGTSKSTMLRRKLVPNEGVLLLTEIEDPLNDVALPHETLALNSGRHIGLGKSGNNNYHHNFGTPKFSLQLSSANSASELNADSSNRELFYSNQLSHLNNNQLNGHFNNNRFGYLNNNQLNGRFKN